MNDNSGRKETLFARRLKRLREERGWTQEQLAGLAGLSRGAIANLERNRQPLAGCVITFARLARALDTTVDELIRGCPLREPRQRPG